MRFLTENGSGNGNFDGRVSLLGGAWASAPAVLGGWPENEGFFADGLGYFFFQSSRSVYLSAAVPGSPNYVVAALSRVSSTESGVIAVGARFDAAGNGYLFRFESGFGSPVLVLARFIAGVAGTGALVASKAFPSQPTSFTTMSIDVRAGGVVVGLVNGVEELTITDPSPIAAAGKVLIAGRLSDIDNITGDDDVASASITGDITTDAATPSGQLGTAVPSSLTGNITAADAAPAGTIGTALSTVTTLPFTRNPGNGGRLVSLPSIALAVLTDDANLTRLAGSAALLMGSDGRLQLANGVPAPVGTSVVVVTREPGANGALGVERYILT